MRKWKKSSELYWNLWNPCFYFEGWGWGVKSESQRFVKVCNDPPASDVIMFPWWAVRGEGGGAKTEKQATCQSNPSIHNNNNNINEEDVRKKQNWGSSAAACTCQCQCPLLHFQRAHWPVHLSVILLLLFLKPLFQRLVTWRRTQNLEFIQRARSSLCNHMF